MLISLKHVAPWYYAEETEKGTLGWEEFFLEAPVDKFVQEILAELGSVLVIEDEEEVCVILK